MTSVSLTISAPSHLSRRHLPRYILSALRSFPHSAYFLFPPRLRFVSFPRRTACQPSTKPAATVSMASNPDITSNTKRFGVLFVCLGNICRSPAAEAVFRDLVRNKGLESKFMIDSAGTIDLHEGNPADERMIAASKHRNIQITSLSRPIRPSDFKDFDLIVAMDYKNRNDIGNAFNIWRSEMGLPDYANDKVGLMCSYCKKHTESEVPDPYFGGPQGFEKVLDILEDACESLLESILVKNTIADSQQDFY